MDKKETKLWKRFDKCKTRKCSKLIKKKKSMNKTFEKEQAKACPQKSNMAFYKCSSNFFNGSNMEKAMKNIVECSEMKCSKEKKNLKNYRNQQFKKLL